MGLRLCVALTVLCAGLAATAQGAGSTGTNGANAARQGPACEPLPAMSGAGAGQVEAKTVPVGRDVCVEAHVYDVVELMDGTRFLDVCPGAVPDEDCRFVLLSRAADRDEVGDLRRFRDQDIRLRGTLRSMHGRLGMVISHARQFNGGPEKFRPNPRLLREFNGQSEEMPVRDPNLSQAGHHRSFMNNQERETTPAGKK
jgi:hypothetical protein